MTEKISPIRQIDLLEARANLSHFVALIESGTISELIIAREGAPTVRVAPFSSPCETARILGFLEGQFPSTSQEEFDADNERIAKLFGLEE